MTTLTKNNIKIAVIDRSTMISSTQDMLDLFVTTQYETGCEGMIVYKESLTEDFFDLKTRVAGELLQKCSNYHIKIAIVGDFSQYTSKSLKDFIYESNKGKLVFFKDNVDSAAAALSAP